MNKKGLSILLALSMVFSLNSMAFAEEAVVDEAAVVEEVEASVAEEDDVVTQSEQKREDYYKKVISYFDQVSCDDVALGSTSLKLHAEREIVPYIGKKLEAKRLGLTIADKNTGYTIPVKKIKLTSGKKATDMGQVKFKIASIGSMKELYYDRDNEENKAEARSARVASDITDPEKEFEGGITLAEAKSIYKDLKNQFKSGKNQEFTVYVYDGWIEDSVSAAYVKDLKAKKATLSSGDLNDTANKVYLDWFNYVLITAKNGSVKKVQIVYPEYNYKKGTSFYNAKIKLKTLKKGKDYSVSGDSISFSSSSTYTAAGPIKAK